jgi:hypothetical protein
MAMNSPDKHTEQRARALFHEASRRLDPTTAGRLRAARRTALEAAHAPRHSALTRMLLPTGAFAVLMLASLILWQPGQRGTMPTAGLQSASQGGADLDNDLPPDPDTADPNLYQNLDFYGWLAASDTPRPTNR